MLTIQRKADPQEKIYLHFDKAYYNPGETIWFKAYLFTGIDISTVSKNFYAELLDSSGTLIERKTSPIAGSSASGFFDLPPTYVKALVYIRAYTMPMLNGDTSFLYLKPIQIIVPVKPAMVAKIKAVVAPPSIAFLPEGGNWVAGINSKMAFKIIGPDGNPVEASGYIKASDGTKVVSFTTLHDGMGAFNILPVAGQTYTAVWKDDKNKEYTTALPAFLAKGAVLQIEDVADQKKFIIKRSEGLTDDEKAMQIVGYMNQQVVYQAKVNLLNNNIISSNLPTKQFPSGILTVTLFTKEFKPLAERISFVNNHDFEFDADAFIPQLNKTKRGLNAVQVNISDTTTSNLSLSITDADLNAPPQNEDNIITHLLLTADLHGKVFDPYYYFFSLADSVPYHLDLVMLTHGWRKYDWSRVMAGKTFPPRKMESNYLSLDGQIAGIAPGSIKPGTSLAGFFQTEDTTGVGKGKNFVTFPLDKKGKIFSDGLVFYGKAKLYFSMSDKNLSFDQSMLTVNNGLWNAPRQNFIAPIEKLNILYADSTTAAINLKYNSVEMKQAIQRNRDAHELQGVVVKGKVKTPVQKMDERYSSGLFSGGNAHSFDVAHDPFSFGAQSVFQYLQGKVAGLQISTNGNSPSMSWRGGSPSVYLNEIKTDIQQVASMSMSDVAFIKVFAPGEGPSMGSSGGGVIAVYTKKGEDNVNTNTKGLDYAQLIGYSPTKQFYMPDYGPLSTTDNYTDLRPTLYWIPYILLDKSRKRFKATFYNNDITKRFRVVLEGINADGKLFHVEKIVE